MSEKQIRNILFMICWLLSVTVAWLWNGSDPKLRMDLFERMMKTEQCERAGSIGIDFTKKLARITCWSGEVFEKR